MNAFSSRDGLSFGKVEIDVPITRSQVPRYWWRNSSLNNRWGGEHLVLENIASERITTILNLPVRIAVARHPWHQRACWGHLCLHKHRLPFNGMYQIWLSAWHQLVTETHILQVVCEKLKPTLGVKVNRFARSRLDRTWTWMLTQSARTCTHALGDPGDPWPMATDPAPSVPDARNQLVF